MRKLSTNNIELLMLSLYRLCALSLPLFVVFFVREFLNADQSLAFFERLTDVVLIVAIFKIGVDVYIPGASLVNDKLEVSSIWRNTWMTITIAFYLLALTCYILGIEWQTFLASTLVLSSLLYAEASRLQSRFLLFYLFKAPSAYIILLALLLLSIDSKHQYTLFLFAISILPLLHSWRTLHVPMNDVKEYQLSLATVVSLLIVFLNWKEAFASRHFFNGDDLPAIVTYSRLTIITTFAFMIHNAQVPVRMRRHANPKSSDSLNASAYRGRFKNMIWALTTGSLVVCFSFFYERQYATSVALLMLSSVILVYIGNVVAALVFVRAYKELVKVHLLTIIVYSLAVYLLSIFIKHTFLCISMATLLSQLAFYKLLKIELESWHNKTGNYS